MIKTLNLLKLSKEISFLESDKRPQNFDFTVPMRIGWAKLFSFEYLKPVFAFPVTICNFSQLSDTPVQSMKLP